MMGQQQPMCFPAQPQQQQFAGFGMGMQQQPMQQPMQQQMMPQQQQFAGFGMQQMGQQFG